MESKDIEEKTIDQAIERACREFNVPREKLNIEILSEGSSGLFGIGAKKARIRAALLSLEMALENDFGKPAVPPPSRENRQRPKQEDVVRPPQSAPERTVAVSAIAEKAGALLDGIIKHMGFDFPFSWEEKGETIVFRITGEGTDALIGKGGQTLDAIQYILNKAAIPPGTHKTKIVLDTEEYRVKREEYLVALAARLAEKVKRTRKPVSVDNLNAHDRRVIHMALQGDTALTTKSRGEGAYRKIVIMPARKSDSGKPGDSQS